MKPRRITTFVRALATVVLIAGDSPLGPNPALSNTSNRKSPWRNSHWCRFTTDGCTRRSVWSANAAGF